MGSEIKLLQDYLELVTYGFTNPMPDALDGPWKITAKDVVDGKINYKKARKTTREAFESDLTAKSRPMIGDILLTKDGTLGRLAVVDRENICINQSVALLRTNSKILPHYLFYLLASPKYQSQMIMNADGSVIKHIYITRVGKMEVNIPSLGYQKLVLRYLGDLDNKITLNRQINQTLEQMAQTLFKSWFVDFDPVIDNALDAGNPIPDELQHRAEQRKAVRESEAKPLPDDIRQLFPNAFEESELGWVPKGWGVVNFSEIASIIMGQSPKGDTYNDEGIGTPLVNGPVEFGPYHPTVSKWTTSPTKFSKANDLIVCVRGSTTGRLVVSDGEYCLGRGVCAIRGDEIQVFITYLFKAELDKLLGFTTGSTFPSWNGPILKNHRVVSPEKAVVNKYCELVDADIKKLSEMDSQICTLTKLRDTLLPKLISGELRLDQLDTTSFDEVTAVKETETA